MAEVQEVAPKTQISGYGRARPAALRAAQAAHDEPTSAEGPPISTEAQTKGRAEAVNTFLGHMNVSLRFNVDKSSNSIMIMIVDTANGEVIRTVPPEYFMKAAGALEQKGALKGIILDEDV